MCEHTRATQSEEVLRLLCTRIERVAETIVHDSSNMKKWDVVLTRLCRLLYQFLTHRHGSRVTCRSLLFHTLSSVLTQWLRIPSTTWHQPSRFIVCVWRLFPALLAITPAAEEYLSFVESHSETSDIPKTDSLQIVSHLSQQCINLVRAAPHSEHVRALVQGCLGVTTHPWFEILLLRPVLVFTSEYLFSNQHNEPNIASICENPTTSLLLTFLAHLLHTLKYSKSLCNADHENESERTLNQVNFSTHLSEQANTPWSPTPLITYLCEQLNNYHSVMTSSSPPLPLHALAWTLLRILDRLLESSSLSPSSSISNIVSLLQRLLDVLCTRLQSPASETGLFQQRFSSIVSFSSHFFTCLYLSHALLIILELVECATVLILVTRMYNQKCIHQQREVEVSRILAEVLSRLPNHLGALEFATAEETPLRWSRDEVERVMTALYPLLYSPSHNHRLAVLRFLSRRHATLSAYVPYSRELLEQCLCIETNPFVATETKRILLHFSTLSELLNTLLPQESSQLWNVRLLTAYLCGCFHIKFSPVWSAATQILSLLAERTWQVFWEGIVPVLQKAEEAALFSEIDETSSTQEHTVDSTSTKMTTFSDFSTHITELRMNVMRGESAVLYAERLWGVLAAIPTLVEDHSRVFVPLFLSFLRVYYPHTLPPSVFDTLLLPPSSAAATTTTTTTIYTPPRRLLTKRLTLFLSLFASFRNPRGLQQHEILHHVYLQYFAFFEAFICFFSRMSLFSFSMTIHIFILLVRLLTRNNEEVAKLALQCLATYRFEWLTPYLPHLERLISDRTLREELVLFPLAPDTSTIQPQHRLPLTEIIIRILWPKLSSRRGRSGKVCLFPLSSIFHNKSVS
jgi:hypothetical protein